MELCNEICKNFMATFKSSVSQPAIIFRSMKSHVVKDGKE